MSDQPTTPEPNDPDTPSRRGGRRPSSGSALRYPVQIISYPTIRRDGNVTILGHIHWLTYNDFTSKQKEFDSCRITWNDDDDQHER